MSQELEDLAIAVGVTAEVCGTVMSEAAAAMMCHELSKYPPSDVSRALQRCQREVTGKLSLAAILERLDSGHPSDNEAWNMVPKSEEESAVVTQQIHDAMGSCLSLLDDGDKIAARMAFLEVYRNLDKSEPPEWVLSRGFHQPGREAAVVDAVERGRMTAARGLALCRESLRLGAMADEEALLLGSGERHLEIEISEEQREANLERAGELVASLKLPSA